MKTLLFEYVPALFLLGTLVRDCNWGGGDSSPARKGVHYWLHILVQLTMGCEHPVEYVLRVLTAILMWCPWMTRSRAQGHSEEACEAVLSHLISSMHHHQTSLMLFATLTCFSGLPVNVKRTW